MNDLGIVFNHHDTSPATLQNLQALRDLNPGVPIFTVSAREPFPDGWNVEDLGEGGRIWKSLTQGDKNLEWRNCDWLSYAWILGNKARCRRWVFVGWDVYSTMPLGEYLRGVWDQDIAGVEIFRGEKDAWHWFQEKAPEELFAHRCGLCPVCFYFCSDECARAVAEMALKYKDWTGFCEFRLGTFARAAGFQPALIAGARKTISWRREGWTIEGRGIWHPVKNVIGSHP